MVGEEAVGRRVATLWPHLNERQRRLLLGAEARELGRGSMSIVYEARDLASDRFVALKMMQQEFHYGERLRAMLREVAESVSRMTHWFGNSLVSWYSTFLGGSSFHEQNHPLDLIPIGPRIYSQKLANIFCF